MSTRTIKAIEAAESLVVLIKSDRDPKEPPPNVVTRVSDLAKVLAKSVHKGSDRSVVDLFCGMGGFSLGLRKAGWNSVVAVEFMKDVARVFGTNHPETAVFNGDVQKVREPELKAMVGKVGLVCGGPPCEGFSGARHARGAGEVARMEADPRRNLVKKAMRIAFALEPTAVLFENVPPARKHPAWKRAVTALESAGYSADMFVCNSAKHGAPQARKRVFICAIKGKVDVTPPPEVPGKRTIMSVIGNLGAPMKRGSDGVRDMYHVTQNLSPQVLARIKRSKPGDKVGHNCQRLRPDEPSLTIIAGQRPVHPTQDRYLTAREALRIQEFPDNYKMPGVPESRAYSMAGDVVPVAMSKAWGNHLKGLIKKARPMTTKAELLKDAADALADVMDDWPVDKGENPHEVYPSPGKHESTVQYHFRGASLHGDFRVKVNGELVGWTMGLQKAGQPEVTTVKEAEELAGTFDPSRSTSTNKPFVSPHRIWATPKEGMIDEEWLRIAPRKFEPGEDGASEEKEGVIVEVDRPHVEWGMQTKDYHEYFLTGSKTGLDGVLMFTKLEGGDRELWNCFLSRDHLPTVLSRESVRSGWMPPDGQSAMPSSMMKQVPAEHRFWERKGDEARTARDALVEAKLFTEGNVGMVDGELVRKDGDSTDVLDSLPELRVDFIPESVAKADDEERYVLGIVLEPETKDAQNDIYSAETIKEACHKYLAKWRNRGYMHKIPINDEVDLVENIFVHPEMDLKVNGKAVKKGTWLAGFVVHGDAYWKKIKDSELTGLSIGGTAERRAE